MYVRSRLVTVLTALTVAFAALPAIAEEAPARADGTAGPGADLSLEAEVTVGASASAAAAGALSENPVRALDTITFSEVPYGTSVRDQYVQRGIRFGGDAPFVTSDAANPTSPVLSGSPLFQGAIEGYFVNPDGTARTVDKLVLDVGYIDTPHSVAIFVYGADGTLLLTVDLAAGGIVHTNIDQPGIGSFRVVAISEEPAGFAIDNVSFPSPAPGGGADRYVALGDSFQSGQGAGSYEAGTDEGDGNGCRRSANAYPNLLIDENYAQLTLDFRACSGATIRSLIDGKNGEPSQLDALGDDTRLVTIGIVGNDLDFAGTLAACILYGGATWYQPWALWKTCEGNLGGGVDERIDSLRDGEIQSELLDLYRTVREMAPYARIVVINYPKFFSGDGVQSMPLIACQGIRTSDQLWINAKIVEADTIINRTATRAGFEYVDMVDVLAGHEECTHDTAINGVLVTDRNASFHPNARGHRMMADRIEQYLDSPVLPAFTIRSRETVTGAYTIRGSAFTLNISWPGSDIRTTLISPSGVHYTREEPNGAEHGNGPTWEYFTVQNPEPGEWTVEYYGEDVSVDGEPVRVTALDETPLNIAPTAQFTATRTGPIVTFDATASVDTDGSIVDYLWDFGDGQFGHGAVVTHTFRPGAYEVSLVATDDAGAKGFASDPEDILVIGADPGQATIYSASSLTLTNSFSADGTTTGVLVNGDFTCNSAGTVAGDVTVTGDAYLTNSCTVGGTLWVAGNVTANSAVRVGGDIRAGRDVSLQSTVRVTGSVATSGTVTSIDGKSIDELRAGGTIGGSVDVGASVLAPIDQSGFAVDTAVPAGANRLSWKAWLQDIATRAGAPSWSPALGANPGCTLASYTAGTSNVVVAGNTFIDARQAGTGCPSVSLQGLTIDLTGDLTLVADSIQATNGLTVTASDGEPHRLRLVTPGLVTETVGDGGITLLGVTIIAPTVAVSLETPGTVQINGPAQLTGQIIAGRVAAAGSVTVYSEIASEDT